MTDLELLRAARVLIADPAHWCQGAPARDSHGREMGSGPRAVQWCAVGALWSATSGDAQDRLIALLDRVSSQLFPNVPPGTPDRWNVPAVNDTLGHSAVMDLYDEAIRRLEQQAGPS